MDECFPGAAGRDVAAGDAQIAAGGSVEPRPVFDDLLVQCVPFIDAGTSMIRLHCT